MACARDILFYVNVFGWTYDPRSDVPAVPFITYEFQDAALMKFQDVMGRRDLVVEKTRDMGVSWLVLVAMEHAWHFLPRRSFLLVSRKEEYVDKPDDPRTLFWKLDFFHQCQPKWLLPVMTRQSMHLKNEDNGSVFDGESTNQDVARGARLTAILLDEFAAVENGTEVLSATADATRCRFFVSTPKGMGNAFYRKAHDGTEKITLHWRLHPEKGWGLWKDADGKWRSPWYDAECRRRAHPQEISQELDIDYLGSDYTFFDAVVLDRIVKEDVRPPVAVGDIDYDMDSLKGSRFIRREGGPLRLWIQPDGEGRFPSDRRYVVGADIATGQNVLGDGGGGWGSQSVLSVVDRLTGDKVAEYASPRIDPTTFGRLAVAMCRLFGGDMTEFGGAYLIWEANGPGRLFSNAVIESGYRNIFWRQNERSVVRQASMNPGWYATKENKLSLLGEYRKALEARLFRNHSYEAIDECRAYVFTQNGSVMHSRAAHSDDPTGSKENHGDRVIADALCWRAMKEVGVSVKKPEQKVEPGTFIWRRNQRRAARMAEEYW